MNTLQMKFWGMLLFALYACFFASCSDDNPNVPGSDGEAEYTLMIYGCGGGNLDQFMQHNLNQALRSVSEKVKLTAEIKYSSDMQDEDKLKGTHRFILKDVNKDGEWDQDEVTDISTPLYKPATLADFIKWSVKESPAKNYILVIWNHGGGWDPKGDAPLNADTRAALYDDNVKDENGNAIPMSLDQLVAGVKQSGVHLKMLYYDACLMNMLENLTALTDVADYALGSVHIVPGAGGDYSSLMEHLTKTTPFTDAMKRYCEDVVEL
jgi:hypothetical protein